MTFSDKKIEPDAKSMEKMLTVWSITVTGITTIDQELGKDG